MNQRTKRIGRMGISALTLALLAGTACAQQSQTEKSKDQTCALSQGQGAFIPQLKNRDLCILQKETDDNKTVTLTVDHGQVVSAQVDGQDVPLDRVQFKGNNTVAILDESKSQKLAEIKVPAETQFGYRGYNEQRFGMNEGRYQDRYVQQDPPRYYQESRNYNTGQDSRAHDRYNQDRFAYTERYYPSEQQNRFTYSEPRYQSEPRDRYTYGEQRPYSTVPERSFSTNPDRSYSSERYYPSERSYGQQRYYTPSDQPSYDRRTMGTTEGGYYSSSRPMLGVMMTEADRSDLRSAGVDTNRFGQGILIEQVNAGSPAESAGLQRGDIIVAIDGNQPATTEQLRDTLARKDFNDTLRLTVIRNGSERNVNVRLFRPEATVNRNFYTSETQWDHRMPQSVPPQPNAEFQPGNSNWRPGDYRRDWYYDQNTYSPR